MEWDKIWAFNKKVIDPVAVRYVRCDKLFDSTIGSIFQVPFYIIPFYITFFRYTALNAEKTIPVNVIGTKKASLTVQNHPKDPTKGTKKVLVGPKLLIERDDAENLTEGCNATFINWGNLMILKINRNENNYIMSVDARLNLDNKNYKDTLKITWLAEHETEKRNPISCYAVYFDHLLSVSTLPKDDDFKKFAKRSTRVISSSVLQTNTQ